jgi:hypothetical protein
MPSIADLGKKVKAKYPGVYDSMSDQDVGAKVKTKYPDAYGDFADSAAVQTVASHAQPTAREAFGRGVAQGATLGFSDELAGLAGGAGVPRQEPSLVLPKRLLSPAAYAQNFEATRPDVQAVQASEADRAARSAAFAGARDVERAKNEAAQQPHPRLYLGGQLFGGMAPAALAAPATGAQAVLQAAGQGATAGAGYSDASEAKRLVGDTALGGTLGLLGHAAGQGLAKGLSWAGGKARQIGDLARARAGAQAAGEVAEQVASARGALGAEVQKGSRYVENLMRLGESMTPEQQALYAQLEASGVVPKLQQAVAQSTLERLPGQASTIATKQAALDAAASGAPQAVAERTQSLLTPQVGADTRSFLKSYAEPAVAAYAAYKAADWAGATPEQKAAAASAAGLIFGRTRAGKAIWNRVNRPAHQAALAEFMEARAAGPVAQSIPPALSYAAPAAAVSPMAALLAEAMHRRSE